MIPPAAAVAGIETVDEDRFEPDPDPEPEAEAEAEAELAWEPEAGACDDDIFQ